MSSSLAWAIVAAVAAILVLAAVLIWILERERRPANGDIEWDGEGEP
jgi:hypothetical protein